MTRESFVQRHIGPDGKEIQEMLKVIGVSSVDELIDKTVPRDIRMQQPLALPDALTESEYLGALKEIAQKNKVYRSFIGMGYNDTFLPPVIERNILENPAWYTSYTPYQAEISQGRLEALLNYQTMVIELTGMEIANASLLDEATAAAEAMFMLFNLREKQVVEAGANQFFIDKNTLPQTLDVLKTRANPLGIELFIGDFFSFSFTGKVFGALVQYPNVQGNVCNYKSFVEKAHSANVKVAVAADLLSLVLLAPPGEWGADIVLGSTQRFGIPLGYGGPHAAFFASREANKRMMPGRIIGVARDVKGKTALRMALQTREQHIKRERATSNICTAQALLAIMAGMYGVYHGPGGLKRIASNVHQAASALATHLSEIGYTIVHKNFFDTLLVRLPNEVVSADINRIALEHEINLCIVDKQNVSVSLDEKVTVDELNTLLEIFATAVYKKFRIIEETETYSSLDKSLQRTGSFMQQRVFSSYRSETDMMRYIKKLERRDISLTHSMISLGSCTMKLNPAVTMMPLTWPAFAGIHPFVPLNQAEGYQQLLNELGKYLATITGFSEVSFQPNSGAAGEYAGLMVIREYHRSRNESHRNVILIPSSAHGTNPASAAMAAFKIVVVACDSEGNISWDDLKSKVEEHKNDLAAFMITYPSTHGVYEDNVKNITKLIHQFGGQVYMDGANMNAQVGLTSPSLLGADVCHINLHKTFAIPHGGGGPGSGPICVAEHLVEFLPTHPLAPVGGSNGIHAVSSSPWGSALIAIISYGYIRLMGAQGLADASKMAILNANYLAVKMDKYFPVVYRGKNKTVAHEMIVDCRQFKATSDITEIDIAKRLMDYGFHAPTLSFPIHGTLMIEPTESESKDELDRFFDSMVNIYNEIMDVSGGKADRKDNVLKNAPHTADEVISDSWQHTYSREKAAFPLPWIRENKFFTYVSRVDDAFGDRNLVCTCSALEG